MYTYDCKGPRGDKRAFDIFKNHKDKRGWYYQLKYMFTEQLSKTCYLNNKVPTDGKTADDIYCPGGVVKNNPPDKNAIYCSQGARIH